jgi:hypothetical protein
MTARGYMIGPSGAANLQIIVNQLYADVSQGNLRYNIATKADIAIIATAANGNKMTKNYRASYNVEGALQATNDKITNAVNSVLTDTIADMSQDTTIHQFIKQNTLSSARWPGSSGQYRIDVQSLLSHLSATQISHSADAWVCLRFTAGADIRYAPGVDDSGECRSENHRFLLACRPGLRI